MHEWDFTTSVFLCTAFYFELWKYIDSQNWGNMHNQSILEAKKNCYRYWWTWTWSTYFMSFVRQFHITTQFYTEFYVYEVFHSVFFGLARSNGIVRCSAFIVRFNIYPMILQTAAIWCLLAFLWLLSEELYSQLTKFTFSVIFRWF